jgi:predicted transcriptional regulator
MRCRSSTGSCTQQRLVRTPGQSLDLSHVVQFALQSKSMAAQHPLSLRLGREGINALEDLARRRGVSRAEAARQAIAETAKRERRRTGLAAEARRLMQDQRYVQEAREVAGLMETLRGPW